ncbi:ribosome maturation factor RimM [Buchnera aphidicola (Mollitrichosiphum nigrofasciatum)]|uniref:ribosome maturation factor RimM n=1 Tax=Buchnera aphidicola TaxID=9 RepID=UPI0031B82F3F
MRKIIKNIKIGKTYLPYGILGWIKICSFTIKKIFYYKPWFIKKKLIYIYIKINKWIKKKNITIIKIHNINTREQTIHIKNKEIFTQIYNLQKLKKNEYYYINILKCHVFTIHKQYLGNVKKILNTKKQDILVIKKHKLIQKKEILIPFVIGITIKKINLIKKTIIVEDVTN